MKSTRSIILSLLLATPVLLSACTGEATSGEDEAAPAAEETSYGPLDTIDLAATGLSVPAQGEHEGLDVPFGSIRASTEASLGVVLGDAREQGENAECPAGPLQFTTYDGMTLYFQDGNFAGWSATAPYVTTATRAELIAEGASLVEDSTLGEEFYLGTPPGPVIAGIFSGEDDAATVETMWAGVSCNFR